jgi:hypothetical protein
MNKKGKILFFCMIFVTQIIFAQKTYEKKHNLLMQELAKSTVSTTLSSHASKKNSISPTLFLSPQFYSSKLGFFCKQEINFDKITKIPFRFRLGSVEQCDRLEGKNKEKPSFQQ